MTDKAIKSTQGIISRFFRHTHLKTNGNIYAFMFNKIIQGTIIRCCRYAHLRTRGNIYTFLFNIVLIWKKTGTRMSYDESTKRYSAVDKKNNLNRYYANRQSAHLFYCDGVKARGDVMGQTYFLNRVDFKDNDIIIDSGANIGDMLLYFQYKNIKVNYMGFEPSPEEYACLKDNVHPHKTYNIGLWNKHDKLNFFVSSNNADSSFIEPPRYDEIIEIDAVPLEKFVNKRVRLLKVEAEGGEPEIIEGLGDKISLVDYITTDLSHERGVNQESTLNPVTNFLLKRGFSMETSSMTQRNPALYGLSNPRICVLYKNDNLK